MKQRTLGCVAIAGVFILAGMSGLKANAHTPKGEAFTIAYDSYAEFIFTENGEAKGYFVDVLTEALERRLGVPVKFVLQPWQRAQFSVEKGTKDAMVTVATPARLLYASASDVPIAVSAVGVFTAVDHPRFEQMKQIHAVEDLGDYRILTYLGDGWAKENLAGLDVDFGGKDLVSVFKKLQWGRGDVFPQTEDVTRHYVDELGYGAAIIRVPGVSLGHIQFHLMIGQSSPFLELLPQINQTLREMKSDGNLERLKAPYRYIPGQAVAD